MAILEVTELFEQDLDTQEKCDTAIAALFSLTEDERIPIIVEAVLNAELGTPLFNSIMFFFKTISNYEEFAQKMISLDKTFILKKRMSKTV